MIAVLQAASSGTGSRSRGEEGTVKVLVIGGSGRTGGQVVRKLAEREHEVSVLSRRTRAPDGARTVQGSVTDLEDVRRAVLDQAGIVIVVESADSDDAPNSPEQVHYHGVRHVIKAVGDNTLVVLVTQIYITRPDAYPEVKNVIYWRGKGEEALRKSGLPYTIIRPSWLTDEPGGEQRLRLEQGDMGEGSVSREDVAEACVQALLHDEARDKTFELYDEPGEPPSDWAACFAKLAAD